MTKTSSEEKILIRETFFSLQGEGFYTGKAAFFIRFAGCDIGCTWCDTKDAWNAENSEAFYVNDIIQIAKQRKTDYVVITGGEPFLHNLDQLTHKLKLSAKFIHIETCGAYSFGNAVFDWLSLSPKRIIPPKEENYKFAKELKVIVQDVSDIKFAEQEKSKVSDECLLFLQPQWEKAEMVLPMIIEYIQDHPEWQLSLQIHKYLKIQ